MKKTLKSYAIVSLGTLLLAIDIYFFKFPNNFSIGGVSGLSNIMDALIPSLSKSMAALIINTFWLIIGFLFFGRGFAIKTVYSSVLLNAILFVFELIAPMTHTLTNQVLAELIYSTVLVALGSALLFNEDASSGGMDIAALLLKRYTSLQVGRAMFFCNVLIVIAATVLFGIETGLLSFMGLLAKTFVVDAFLEKMNTSKCFHIITDRKDEISDYITKTLHRGATEASCHGVFTDSDRTLIISIMNPKEAKQLKEYIKKNCPGTFFVVYRSSEVFGTGFKDGI